MDKAVTVSGYGFVCFFYFVFFRVQYSLNLILKPQILELEYVHIYGRSEILNTVITIFIKI